VTSTRDESAPASRSGVDRLPATAEGSSSAPFTPVDWLLIAIPAAVWGASFLLIAEGLESFEPGVVTWGRLLLGVLTLLLVPRTRATRISRGDWPRVALLGLFWFAAPQTLFAIAEQWVSSAVAGMLNGALPLFAALMSATLLRRLPGRNQLRGLGVGFAGVVCISLPSLSGDAGTAVGAGLVVVALLCYALASNVVVPLQQRYGAIGVIARAQLVALALTTPYAIAGIPASSFAWQPAAAVLLLGVLGTGVAFVAAGTVMGRVGATRGSVIAYLIPVVALVLGVLLRDEHVERLAVVGLALVLIGAWLTSRDGR
jgi:drug/metabolite transporter (DMT)-like permease